MRKRENSGKRATSTVGTNVDHPCQHRAGLAGDWRLYFFFFEGCILIRSFFVHVFESTSSLGKGCLNWLCFGCGSPSLWCAELCGLPSLSFFLHNEELALGSKTLTAWHALGQLKVPCDAWRKKWWHLLLKQILWLELLFLGGKTEENDMKILKSRGIC
jgi:hypothetical protein